MFKLLRPITVNSINSSDSYKLQNFRWGRPFWLLAPGCAAALNHPAKIREMRPAHSYDSVRILPLAWQGSVRQFPATAVARCVIPIA